MAITYVGGQVGGRAGSTSTLSVNYALTGGTDSVPQAGDLVIITVVVGSAARNPACAITAPATWSAYGQLNNAAATNDTSMNVSRKFMGGTPDTAFTLPSTGNVADAQRYTVQVFRGVDPTTPDDVASTTATGSATGRPNPPSITPVTAGAVVVICGGGAAATGASYTAPANFTTNFLTGSTADTTDAMVGSGYWTGWTSGAVDPAAYTGGTTNAADSWCARTIALRPAVNLPTVTTNAVTGISHHAAQANGDITATGGENAIRRGFVYSTTTHGDPGNVAVVSSGYEFSASEVAGSYGTGTFNRALTVVPSTTYFVRAYAENSAGFEYGNEVSFTTDDAPFTFAPSSNIPAGGATATTAQLTAPSGKTSTNFQAGAISDDTNPLAAQNLAADKYTELEFSIQADPDLVEDDVYEFRITDNGVPLDGYLTIPQLTIGAAGETFTQNLGGTLTPVGVLIRAAQQRKTGSSTPVGVLRKLTSAAKAGITTPTGVVRRQGQKVFPGTITPAGAIAFLKTYNRVFGGTTTPVGNLVKQANRRFTGTVTPAGIIQKQDQKRVTGTITLVGTIVNLRLVMRSFTGTINLGGTITNTKVLIRVFTGTVTPVGAILRNVQRNLSGVVTPTGILARAATRARILTGTITPLGTVFKQAQKRAIGTITLSGVVTAIKVVIRVMSGAITPVGVIVRQTQKRVTGIITPVGAIRKAVSRTMIGTLTLIGSVLKLLQRNVVGMVQPIGVINNFRIAIKQFTGIITPTGVVRRSLLKSVAGILTPVGTLVRFTSHRLTGALSPVGNISKSLTRSFIGVITPVGLLFTQVGAAVTSAIIHKYALVSQVIRKQAMRVDSIIRLQAVRKWLIKLTGEI